MNLYSFVCDIGTYVAGRKKFGVLHEESAFMLSFNCLSVLLLDLNSGEVAETEPSQPVNPVANPVQTSAGSETPVNNDRQHFSAFHVSEFILTLYCSYDGQWHRK
jgi:hypothetical protein